MGRRPEHESDVFWGVTIRLNIDSLTFVFETAETSGSVIGHSTLSIVICRVCAPRLSAFAAQRLR